MYKTIITLKSGLPQDILVFIQKTASAAFNNRAGFLTNMSNDDITLLFEGDDAYYACLELGTFELKDNDDFMNYVQAWQWIDKNPKENCDMLQVFSRQAG